MSLNATFQYDDITAKVNYCGERGPKGEPGEPGLSDLSNFVQTPINLTSLYDESGEETQPSHIKLKTLGYQDNDDYAQILLEGDVLHIKSIDESTPAQSGLTISPDGFYATANGYPSYENAQLNFQNSQLTLKTYAQDPISYETNQHLYKFEEGFAKVQNFGSGPFRAINLRESTNDPDEILETWYPQAYWPVGMSYLNTNTNGLFLLGGIKEEYSEDYGTEVAVFDWQKIPAVKPLWTNADPTAVFAGQDITLSDSLANYRWFLIESGTVANSMTIVQHSGIFRTDFTMAAGAISSINSSSTKVQLMTRNIGKTSDTKIHIYDGVLNEVVLSTGVWTQTSNSGVLKPLRIFGIK